MAKRPSFQFYPKDWLSDVELRKASWQTRGIWMDVLCHMHCSKVRGELSGTIDQLCRLVGTTPQEMEAFIVEIRTLLFCYALRGDNGVITLRNRRMYKDGKHKEQNRLRQQRYRASRSCNAENDNKVTLHSAFARKKEIKKEKKPTQKPSQKTAKKQDRNPATLAPTNFPITDQMKTYAKDKGYHGNLQRMTDKFLAHHTAAGSKFKSWYAAWQKWLLNDLEWYPRNGRPQKASSPAAKPWTPPYEEKRNEMSVEEMRELRKLAGKIGG
jgi:hypothetical protein